MKKTLFLFFILPLGLVGQNQHAIDSLFNVFKISTEDTVKVESLFSIAKEKINQPNIQQEEVIALLKEALLISKKSKYKPLIAKAQLKLAKVFAYFNNDTLSVKHASDALKIYTALNDAESISETYLTIANIHLATSRYELATENFLKLLKIAETVADSSNIAIAYNGIGNINYEIKDYKNSLSNHKKALQIRLAQKNEHKASFSYINIGNCFNNTNQIDSAIYYYSKALAIQQKVGNSTGPAWTYGNIGISYEQKKDFKKALEYHLLAKEIIDTYGVISVKAGNDLSLGRTYFKLGKVQEALMYTDKSIALLTERGEMRHLIEAYDMKYKILENLKRYKESLDYLKLVNQLKDSLLGMNSVSNINQLQTEYIQTKIAKENELVELAKQEAHKREIQKQQYFIYAVIFFALVLGLIVIIIWIGYKRKIKHNAIITEQKNVVEKQKILVEEKNKEITDSINYAKRIQEAILPSRFSLSENLKNGFVLYKPKDIVSGDFYWLEKANNSIYIAAADCTGHGVPGAMVSVVCSNALSKALLEENITDPGRLLDRTRELVLERFSKSDEEVNDGMDISLCAFSPFGGNEIGVLKWAGANNPLWLIRESKLIEYLPNKQPIGNVDTPQPFTTHSIDLQKADTIYIFSDGFQDQFGGEKGKKFKTSKMKDLLLGIQEKTMAEQKEIIYTAFKTWKGNLEQVDDICVIGVRF